MVGITRETGGLTIDLGNQINLADASTYKVSLSPGTVGIQS